MKILIVEDEVKTGDYLRQGLSEAGYVVDLARNGTDGLHLALHENYDLAVLDVMLPGLDGWHVLKEIRRAGLDLPVLFLPRATELMIGYMVSNSVPTIIWSNPLRSVSLKHGLRRSVADGRAP